MGDVVITIPHPESAIVIGAVYDAIRGSVESRKSRENWGLEVMMPWDSTKHTSLHSKKTIDGKNYAQNCYFPITQKASIVGVTDYIEYEFKTVNPYQSVMKFNFLSSKDDIVSSNTSNIITQGTCQILVPLENPGDGRTLALRIFNGTSEINYQIYDRNNKAAEGTLMLKSIDTTAKHFIFAFDNSGSMDDRDITPSSSYQSNRLGTVLESFDLFIENLKKSDQTNPNNLYSVVSFDHYSTTWMKHMNLDSVPNSSSFDLEPSGGTAYRSALENIYNDVLEVPKPSSSSRSSMINELAKKTQKLIQ